MVTRRCMVFGGTSGVGREVALSLASQGISTMALGRSREPFEEMQEEAAVRNATDHLLLRSCDATHADDVRASVLDFTARVGSPNCLVVTVGHDNPRPFLTIPIEEFDEILATNLHSTLVPLHFCLGAMVEQGWGRVVAVTTDAARGGSKGVTLSAAGKAGVHAALKCVARETARAGVTCNAIALGPTRTPFLDQWFEEHPRLTERLVASVPVGRPAHTSEISAAVEFLLSESASFVTGQVISVSGGLTMTG